MKSHFVETPALFRKAEEGICRSCKIVSLILVYNKLEFVSSLCGLLSGNESLNLKGGFCQQLDLANTLKNIDTTVFLRSIMLHHKLRHAFGPCTRINLAHVKTFLIKNAWPNNFFYAFGATPKKIVHRNKLNWKRSCFLVYSKNLSEETEILLIQDSKNIEK
ncbi:hypothetical protein BpHYR1_051728 [Brachionus plicatilis]|uniref:Uncharacterized protein n=1 Tax=Brachionus plicatilis TaxID=10195 RepID=A0A3M7QGP5_BRAPC|nr:hypothetical protein BpHYR1_051728 [Brachionus plicatilis]